MTRTKKWMGSVGCFGQKENIKRQSLYKQLSLPKRTLCKLPAIRQQLLSDLTLAHL